VSTRRQLDPQSLPDHLDRLFRAAWALTGSRVDAEDLVQETYVRVLARPRLLRGDDDLGYLLRVLRNTFLTGRRTAGRRPQTTAFPEDVEPLDPRIRDRPETVLETRALFEAIAALPPDFRDALVAVDIVGLSYREASQALGVREATVTSRIYRARQGVAAALQPEPQVDEKPTKRSLGGVRP
jgi:RNA polymerase sigma-70 factor (ECF subfamily)